MSRRLFPTLADYVIVAINPALVMTLVGSLVYFLLELLYQGNYPERLHFSLTMFVFAIVLVSRIAMEEGFEHAAPFGMALAVVVWLAMQRFVDYGHGALGHFGWLLNGGLMALSWWCAHKLTWDSTVIDESEESEGQGLLETVGIDRASGEVRAAEQSTAKETAAAKAQQAAGEPDAPRPKKGKRFRWEDLLNRKDRPHAPGVWIVYFSLAALPIFGIGQAFIPAVNTASRRYAFLLFVVYVASGLGLLLTTSFLALRRYLRQRHLEMPTRMVGTWLTTGVVMIVALLAIVALLPRPNAEFAVSQLPWPESKEDDEDDQPPDEAEKSTEDDQPKSSSVSAGQEGTRDKEATTGGGADHSPDAKSDQNSQGGAGPQPGGQAEASGRQQNRTGDQDDAGTKKGDPSSQGGKSGDESKQSGGDGKQSSNDKGGGSADQKSDSAGDQKSASNADSKESKDAQGKDGKAEPKPPDGAKSEQAKTKAEKEKAKAKPDSASGAKGAQPAKAKPPTSGPSQTPASFAPVAGLSRRSTQMGFLSRAHCGWRLSGLGSLGARPIVLATLAGGVAQFLGSNPGPLAKAGCQQSARSAGLRSAAPFV